ncbi:ABC transporter permease [Bacillus sp. AFS077874]|uniref:IclR family transcriptional regulator n=1 Tax=unclassified Bacillus (in: firmicutes) TaxID=185979 RepID=UPI000BEB7C82|nr:MULTISPECIES: IclR family transcriptional regulator [unclassified Bacillus (in: firmicutes)]PEC48371.1 ABC transporter permease [Bacillus sp. AFS096315]PFM81205.1 ABC transporter permease [Bacillus sp. AFS077874]
MVQSIDRAMLIIDILNSDESKSNWQITELAEKTSLSLGTLHRLLNSLIQHGLVIQIPETKHYKLGYKWMELGLRQLDKMDFRLVARPVMERLANHVEESIYLNIESGIDGIVIDKIDSPLKIRIAENLGIRIPLHIGAPNKTLLAYMKENEIQQVLDQLNLSPDSISILKQQLVDIRKNGYAISQSEKTEDTAAIAAPITGYNNKVLGALSVNVPGFRFTQERIPYLIEEVMKAAEEISKKIGKI